jgi:hypothetical protein
VIRGLPTSNITRLPPPRRASLGVVQISEFTVAGSPALLSHDNWLVVTTEDA